MSSITDQTLLEDGGNTHTNTNSSNSNGGQSASAVEKWSRTPRPRGRQAKDPMAIEVRYQCSCIENMEANLQHYIVNPTAGPPEHTTLEFTFPVSAAFMIYGPGSTSTCTSTTSTPGPLGRTAISVIDALSQVDAKERLRKQKAIAKAIVDCVSGVDGYRYSFHNSWLSKEDAALRFSYFCNDSTLNKGRAANEGAGMAGKKKVKPVYDCKGVIHIKFSATKQMLGVLYRHVPLHQTYEARAPPPRKGSKRRKILELFAPDRLPQHSSTSASASASARSWQAPLDRDGESTEPRARNMSRQPLPSADPATAASDDSLAPLMDFLAEGNPSPPQQPVSPDRLDPSTTTTTTTTTRSNGKQSSKQQSSSSSSSSAAASVPGHGHGHGHAATIASHQGRRKGPSASVPGTMTGFLVGSDLEIEWALKPNRPPTTTATASIASKRQVNNPTEGGALQGIAEQHPGSAPAPAPAPAPATPTSDTASELDILKQKLLAAERRIERLEAEKRGAPAGGGGGGGGGGPGGWAPPPPPPPPALATTHSHSQTQNRVPNYAPYSYHPPFLRPAAQFQYQQKQAPTIGAPTAAQ